MFNAVPTISSKHKSINFIIFNAINNLPKRTATILVPIQVPLRKIYAPLNFEFLRGSLFKFLAIKAPKNINKVVN